MKLLLLPLSLLTLAATTQAQQVQFALKAAVGCSLPSGKQLPVLLQAIPISGGSGLTIQLRDPHDYRFEFTPGFTAGLLARYPMAGRWSYGAELLFQYQPLSIEQRFSPEKAGYNEYVSTGGSGGVIRDQNGNLVITGAGRNGISRADLPTVYRYSMASLELPLYTRYAVAERWHLQAGVAPTLLVDKQVRIETSYPEARANGQATVATTRKKQDDPALRLVNWRLVAEVEYQLTSHVACTLSLRPSLSNVFSTTDRQQQVVPYQVKQHAISLAAVYFLQ